MIFMPLISRVGSCYSWSPIALQGCLFLVTVITFNAILSAINQQTQRSAVPVWLRPPILRGYHPGMRLSEMRKLNPKQVFLDRRTIFLPDPKKIKERKAKRIPIHRDLHPILERILQMNPAECEHAFMICDEDGTRPVTKNTVESAFRRMFKVLRPEPRFSFHDLRPIR